MTQAKTKPNNSGRKFRGQVVLNPDRCKGCGFCVEFCPTHVLGMNNQLNTKGYHTPVVLELEACTGCDLCGLFCPDFAIHGYRVPNTANAANKQGKQGGSHEN